MPDKVDSLPVEAPPNAQGVPSLDPGINQVNVGVEAPRCKELMECNALESHAIHDAAEGNHPFNQSGVEAKPASKEEEQ